MGIDRSEYKLLPLDKLHDFECELNDENPTPETSTFIIFGEDIEGTKIAVSIPFSELDDLTAASAAATQNFPEGRRIQ